MTIIHKIFNYSHNIFRIAFIEILMKYKRSVIGPFWITISTLILILGISFVNSSIFGFNSKQVVPWVGIGIIIWNYISSIFEDAFDNYSKLILLNLKLHFFDLTLTSVFKNMLIFLHNVVIIIFIIFYYDINLINTIYYIPLSIIFFLIDSICISILISFLCLRYRDFILIIRNLLFICFLMTPVFWFPDVLQSNRTFLLDYNIFYHVIQIARNPLLGILPSINLIFINFIFSLFLICSTYLTYKKFYKKAVFWI
jgi:ABC-type polysaccharide/polyol phosphate export permease